MSAPPETLPYRPCVGLMLLDKRGRVFVAQRLDMPSEAWQMPQGGIDPGESVRQAGRRELREEIGTDNAEIITEGDDWLYYDLPNDLIGKLWKGRYRGQMQKWLVLRFTGDDSEININTAHPEFSAWKWADIDDLPDLIVPFKRDLYIELVTRFRPFAVALAKGEASPPTRTEP